MQIEASVQPFFVKDCALVAIATGEKASRLDEFRDKLVFTPIECFYYHFWGRRLHTHFAQPDYHNDFSAWVQHGLHDQWLAEKLNIIDPTDYDHLESLRQNIIEMIEERLDEVELVPVAKKEQQFHFIRSQTIVFQTPYQIHHPREFQDIIPKLSPTSIFFHFIERRRHKPKSIDDFSNWLQSFGNQYEELMNHLRGVDPYFLSLSELKEQLINIFFTYFRDHPS